VVRRDGPIEVLDDVAIAGGDPQGPGWHRAWPGLEVLPDGDLLVAYKASVDHNRSDDAAV
jgi:hypothetical protein